MSESLQARLNTTPLSGGNAPYVEALYEQYLQDPASVPQAWADYFRGLQSGARETARGPIEAELLSRAHAPRAAAAGGGLDPLAAEKQAAVIRLIEAYRGRGHLHAKLDPLGLTEPASAPDLELEFHGLSQADMATVFSTVSLTGPDRQPLKDIWQMMQQVYCGTIGFEFMHVTNAEERLWLKSRIEGSRARAALSADERLTVLRNLTAAEGLEKYLHTKYVGQKRFSLEGGDSLMPLLHDVVQKGGAAGIQEIVVGMAHRGRLNVLINLLGKSPKELFLEFEGVHEHKEGDGSGDVKYHMGFSSDIKTPGGNVHLALAFNPSHLEIVNPVVEGSVRARQDRRDDVKGEKILPVLVHGDAAFAGQGVGMETLQFSQTRGFSTGGTYHVVLNNQVGFTISDPRDSRSTQYCTDLAKMLEAPVFHVNGDDPEAVIFVSRLALDYRQTFHKDVFIDLVCYRRHGHNEADEPSATQPVMYQHIKSHATPRALYAGSLAGSGVLDAAAAAALTEQYRKDLDAGKLVAPGITPYVANEFSVDWSRFQNRSISEPFETKIDKKRMQPLMEAMNTVPAGVELHPRVAKIYDDRRKMAAGELPMDWGFAETLAYASLVSEGCAVRLTGQDSGRGTFFHRHAVLHNQKDYSTYTPLQHIAPAQKHFTVVDSLLSEEAVMGFEYGYSTADPDALVIWEAQFGDFANGAQVVIDQFMAAGEAKWGRLCGLTLFLPHGYEGQGPEHSSARLERYLQLCAEHNMQVCVPSNPAQMFHMIRRQALRPFRKPLVVMTPKSLLRHKLSVSALADLSGGGFQPLIPEVEDIKAAKVQRVVFCSGKVYYDLVEARHAAGLDDTAIVRIEQLYPFPQAEYAEVLAGYPNARDIVWCQEEPGNQGAWYQIRHRLQEPLKQKHELRYAGRPHAASTAAGYMQLHVQQQKALIQDALGTANEAKQGAAAKDKTKPNKVLTEKA
ncbi:MAG TPA: 2-oxoglutarate dehydrogenase E1 component [Gammaproteobacteria bacterium]|nr:2-oxoglutarate dehydrogenase E1 component [Gammaproteobacteria bacterium]